MRKRGTVRRDVDELEISTDNTYKHCLDLGVRPYSVSASAHLKAGIVLEIC